MQILLERSHQREGMPNPVPMKRSALSLLCLELLQGTQRCVDAAQSISDLKDCRQRKKQARRSLKQDRRALMNQVREDVGLLIRRRR